MIDFRYHLVSIIAVFLALAVGLLVGVTALSGPVQHALQGELSLVHRNESSLAKKVQELNGQVNADQALLQVGAPRLLGGLLTGQNVVLVTAPAPDSSVVSSVTTALKDAGATVTAQVSLSPSFLDTSAPTEQFLSTTATGLAGSYGIPLPSPSSSTSVSGQQMAAAVIAAAILDKDGAGLPASASRQILAPFEAKNYLHVTMPGSAATPPPATLAVLVIPAGSPPPAIDTADQALVAVAQQLRSAGRGAVMAGAANAIGAGSAISAASGQISTVDNANTESGQIMVVWALLKDGTGPPKAFGVGTGQAPSPAPTPSPTVSTPPSQTTSAGGKKTGAKK